LKFYKHILELKNTYFFSPVHLFLARDSFTNITYILISATSRQFPAPFFVFRNSSKPNSHNTFLDYCYLKWFRIYLFHLQVPAARLNKFLLSAVSPCIFMWFLFLQLHPILLFLIWGFWRFMKFCWMHFWFVSPLRRMPGISLSGICCSDCPSW